MISVTPQGTQFEISGPQNQPTVILIHGLGLNSACWQWTAPALNNHFQTIVYDLYGHGKSAPPPSTPDLKLFSDQLKHLMDHCDIEQATIIGFSLGGMIARRFAQDVPTQVSGLGILHSPHQRSAAAQSAILKRVKQAKSDGPASTVEAALKRWFTEDYRIENPDVMDLVRSWVMANDVSIYHTIYQVLADGIDEITRPHPPITCATLVITGDEDYGNGPEMTAAIANEIQGAKTHILDGLRHMALAESPDRMNAPLIEFLEELNGIPS